MGILLQIIGVLFLLLVALVVIGVLVIRAKLRKLRHELGKSLAELSDDMTPQEIHLQPWASPQWKAERDVEYLASRLESEGFLREGAFLVAEMEAMKLLGFRRPQDGTLAVVYEHEQIEAPWVDLFAQFDNGCGLTVSNAPQGEEMDIRPGNVKHFLKSAPMEDLLARFREEMSRLDAWRRVGEGEFVTVFEQAYRDDMTWRRERGGTTAEEVRRVAARMDDEEDE